MIKPVLCKEVAEKQIEDFAGAWGLYDSKAIISGGKESSIPPEMTEILLAAVMTGCIEVNDDGKTLVQHLQEPIQDVSALTYKRARIKKHHMTEIEELKETDQVLAIASIISGASEYVRSEMTSRDMAHTIALATYLSFT